MTNAAKTMKGKAKTTTDHGSDNTEFETSLHIPRSLTNKFVRTKMRLKLGTNIDLSERFVRLICKICQILFSKDSMSFPRDFRDFKKRETDGPTDHGWTDGPTDGQTLL